MSNMIVLQSGARAFDTIKDVTIGDHFAKEVRTIHAPKSADS